jgi:uncharacterized membrane protein (UPF0127 family)
MPGGPSNVSIRNRFAVSPRLVMRRAFLYVGILCIFAAGGALYAQRLPMQNVEALPHVDLSVGGQRLSVPVARTPEQRRAGLRGSTSPVLLFAWHVPVASEFNMLGCDRPLWRFDFVDRDRLGVPTVMQPGTRTYPVPSPVRCVLEVDPTSAVAKHFAKPGVTLKLPSFCS